MNDPFVIMTAHSVDDPDDAAEVVLWQGSLSGLFSDWRKNGTDCEEQTGRSETAIRDEIQDTGVYQIDGFVGCYYRMAIVQKD